MKVAPGEMLEISHITGLALSSRKGAEYREPIADTPKVPAGKVVNTFRLKRYEAGVSRNPRRSDE